MGRGTNRRAAFVLASWLASGGVAACVDAAPPALVVEVRALWLRGADDDRSDMDRYFECLLEGSDPSSAATAASARAIASAPGRPM